MKSILYFLLLVLWAFSVLYGVFYGIIGHNIIVAIITAIMAAFGLKTAKEVWGKFKESVKEFRK